METSQMGVRSAGFPGLSRPMAAPEGVRFRDLLLDPGYWRPRLEKLGTVPWRLLVFPRPDLSRPGVEVIELSMRAHDGVDLRCILARPAFSSAGDVVHLRVVEEFAFAEPDWNLIEEGRTDLVVTFPPPATPGGPRPRCPPGDPGRRLGGDPGLGAGRPLDPPGL